MDLHSLAQAEINLITDRMYVLVYKGDEGIKDGSCLYQEYKEWFDEDEVLIMSINKIHFHQ